MSKERAVRRAARQSHAAAAAAERARRTARDARRRRLTARLTALAPSVRWRSATGPLAARRRRTVGLMTLGFVVAQALTWAATPDWGTRAAVAVVSLFALPVVAVFLL